MLVPCPVGNLEMTKKGRTVWKITVIEIGHFKFEINCRIQVKFNIFKQ